MPLALSVTSLMNALAHPLSALSTGQLSPPGVERALAAAHEVYTALRGVSFDARALAARSAALKGTVLAGEVLRDFAVGVHHKLAHALGGRFDLDHAGLHSVLLPHSVAWLKEQAPALHAAVQTRLGDTALPSTLFGFLEQAGAATSLAGLGLTGSDFASFLAQQPAPYRALLEAAFRGQRP
jgi:maleylacetate reductase